MSRSYVFLPSREGLANYYSVDVGGTLFKDIVWSYRAPTLESGKIS